MSNSWALDENWDMYMGTDNRIGRVVGLDEVQQNLKQRLQFFFEEWFLDRNAGVPWFQQIFVKPVNLGLVNFLVRKEILETKHVKELLEFSVVLDENNRNYKVVSFTVDTDFGILSETL